MEKTIVVIGAGSGLGFSIAKKFAGEGFKAVLMARHEDTLKKMAEELTAAGAEVAYEVADVLDENGFATAMEKVKATHGTPSVVVYNVGLRGADPDNLTSQDLITHFKADVAGAYAAVKSFADETFADKNGAIIFTGGGFGLYPSVKCCPLSIDKAALRSLAYILHNQYKPLGIFVGTVTICGSIDGDKYLAADNIAECYWQMFTKRDKCEYVYQYPALEPEKLYVNQPVAYGLFEENASSYWEKVSKASFS